MPCQSETFLLVSGPLTSSVSERPGVENRGCAQEHFSSADRSRSTKGILYLPCALLCWASEESGRGQRSCDWSRCRWATASSRWRTGSRLSAPDPRRMGLLVGGMRRKQEREKNKEREAVISTWAPQDQTVQKDSEPHYEGRGEVSLGEIWIYIASLEPDSNSNLQVCQLNWGREIGFIKDDPKVLLDFIHNWFPPIFSNDLFKWNSVHLGAFDLVCLI